MDTPVKKVAARKPSVKKVVAPQEWASMNPEHWPPDYQQTLVHLLDGFDTKQLVAVHTVLSFMNGKEYRRFFRWYRDKKSVLPGGSAAPTRKI